MAQIFLEFEKAQQDQEQAARLAEAQAKAAKLQERAAIKEKEERAKFTRRWERDRIRSARAEIEWASCCQKLYSRDKSERTSWSNCHDCKKPLVFTKYLPAAP